MTDNKKNIIVACTTSLFFIVLTIIAWFKPSNDFSESERRTLAQSPELSYKTISDKSFMDDFEKYALDQFPFRDKFRSAKAMFSYNILNKSDNNGIYVENGYVSKLDYPLDEDSVKRAASRFEYVYNTYLKNKNTKQYLAVIPDKNYFLAKENGYLAIDYNQLIEVLKENTEFLEYIDITSSLNLTDYYKTDTHWRQECLTDVADKICAGMGTNMNVSYEEKTLDKDFYGVYYGQAALPIKPEKIKYLTNSTLENCRVYDYQNAKEISVYDMEKGRGKDPYELYLSGPLSLITIENRNATTDKELIIFRDSFASSIAPLFVDGYQKITLIDIRYIHPAQLKNYVEFDSQDVLFLYSTMVLNNAETIK